MQRRLIATLQAHGVCFIAMSSSLSTVLAVSVLVPDVSLYENEGHEIDSPFGHTSFSKIWRASTRAILGHGRNQGYISGGKFRVSEPTMVVVVVVTLIMLVLMLRTVPVEVS